MRLIIQFNSQQWLETDTIAKYKVNGLLIYMSESAMPILTIYFAIEDCRQMDLSEYLIFLSNCRLQYSKKLALCRSHEEFF